MCVRGINFTYSQWNSILLACVSGAFLVTYGIAMVFCGIPIFFQEVAVGQYLGAGGMTLVGQLCPILQGEYKNPHLKSWNVHDIAVIEEYQIFGYISGLYIMTMDHHIQLYLVKRVLAIKPFTILKASPYVVFTMQQILFWVTKWRQSDKRKL
jgi:SNF family Na+-dependent transporter